MLIKRTSLLPRGDASKFAWASLQQFQNVSYVTRRIIDLHDLRKSQHGNAKKQAIQIRYCLIQAKEYFDAARTVSICTQPLLLYYGIMSLALAEILLKGTGSQSLDRARGEHAHHGLDLKMDRDPSKIESLAESASSMRAVPVVKGGGRIGTFELWHRVAREYPLGGKVETLLRDGGTSNSIRALLIPEDKQMEVVPLNGITLLDCFCSHPFMRQALSYNETPLKTVRAKIDARVNEKSKSNVFRFTVQPSGNNEILANLYEKMKFKPDMINQMVIAEFPDGCSVQIKMIDDQSVVNMPAGVQARSEEIYFQTEVECLNEFGLLYVGLFILGSYVRYFPDLWMADVENASSLAIVSKTFSDVVLERAPIIALSELSRVWYLES